MGHLSHVVLNKSNGFLCTLCLRHVCSFPIFLLYDPVLFCLELRELRCTQIKLYIVLHLRKVQFLSLAVHSQLQWLQRACSNLRDRQGWHNVGKQYVSDLSLLNELGLWWLLYLELFIVKLLRQCVRRYHNLLIYSGLLLLLWFDSLVVACDSVVWSDFVPCNTLVGFLQTFLLNVKFFLSEENSNNLVKALTESGD